MIVTLRRVTIVRNESVALRCTFFDFFLTVVDYFDYLHSFDF